MTWIHIPHITSSTVSADTGDSASDSDSPTRTPTSKRSATSSGTNIAKNSSSSGSAMTHPRSIPLPSGTTSSPSTDDLGVERWIFLLRDFRANLIQMPASKNAKTIREISGPIPSEQFARWNPDSLFWKTSPDWQPPQDSISRYLKSNGSSVYLTKTITSRTQGPSIVVTSRLMDTHTWDELSGTFPTSITMQSRELSVLPTPGAHICVEDGGSWHIPTPTSADVYTGNLESSQQSDDSMHSVSLPDFVGRFPTPMADEGGARENTISQQERHGPALNVQVMLPTPTGDDANNVTRTSGAFQSLSREVDGSLSPDWVSWLMGLPLKWSSLEPLSQEDYDEWFQAQLDGTWWQEERGLPRIATGVPDRVNRLKCLGNGIVPASLSLFLRGTR
jgi:hypothetical protein